MSFKRKNKILAIGLACLQLLSVTVQAAVDEDQPIVSQKVVATYRGRTISKTLIDNLRFSDVGSGFWGKEAITRLGALDIVKGYNEGNRRQFRPNRSVSKEEGLAFLLRVIGQEEAAKKEAEKINQANQTNQSSQQLWSQGYLTVAKKMGLLTNQQLQEALSADQTALDQQTAFFRQSPATREEVAQWVVQAVGAVDEKLLSPVYRQQAVFDYSDWQTIKPALVPYVEAVSRAGIMKGTPTKAFLPKKAVTRAEMAQVMRNMSEIVYQLNGWTLKNGYIGHVEDKLIPRNDIKVKQRRFLVRNQEGQVDELLYEESYDTKPSQKVWGAPTLRAGQVTSMRSLREGDLVEYLVDDAGQLLYIHVPSSASPFKVTGELLPFNDLATGVIRLKTGQVTQDYQMNSGLYRPDSQEININQRFMKIDDAPISNVVTVTVKNHLVTEINYQGDKTINNEVSGIIKRIDSAFHYLVIEKWQGGEMTINYYPKQVVVEKKPYYGTENTIGYLDELFPTYRFDPYDGKVSDLEPGDVVHIRLNSANRQLADKISAGTNYVLLLGSVRQVINRGDSGIKLMIEKNDGSLASYQVAADIPVLDGERRSTLLAIRPGQRLRCLVNQAVIQPGQLQETIKEIVIEPQAGKVASIYKGQMGLTNQAQQSLTLHNVYRLNVTRWDDYQSAKSFRLNQVRYYYQGKPVTADYVERYLNSPSITAYAVTKKDFSDEALVAISFRDGRDSLLAYDTIESLGAYRRLQLQDQTDSINVDQGTLVVKDNYLVTASSLLPQDYTRVVLNGNRQAAVVEVSHRPGNKGLTLLRGRIRAIEDLTKFKVSSNAALTGMTWIYSPVQREFLLDYQTQIITPKKRIPQSEFIDYSEISKVDKVYTIVTRGTKATHILEQPYAKQGVKGEIYEVGQDEIKLKDVQVYRLASKKWSPLSLKNNYGSIKLDGSAVIFRENEMINLSDLRKGETIRVMSTENMADKLKLKNERTITGYLLFVE